MPIMKATARYSAELSKNISKKPKQFCREKENFSMSERRPGIFLSWREKTVGRRAALKFQNTRQKKREKRDWKSRSAILKIMNFLKIVLTRSLFGMFLSISENPIWLLSRLERF